MIIIVSISSFIISFLTQFIFPDYGGLIVATLTIPAVYYIYANRYLAGWLASIGTLVFMDLMSLHYGLYNLVAVVSFGITYVLSRSLFNSLSRSHRFFLTTIYALLFQAGCLGISFLNLGAERLAVNVVSLVAVIVMSLFLAIMAVLLQLLIGRRKVIKELYAFN